MLKTPAKIQNSKPKYNFLQYLKIILCEIRKINFLTFSKNNYNNFSFDNFFSNIFNDLFQIFKNIFSNIFLIVFFFVLIFYNIYFHNFHS